VEAAIATQKKILGSLKDSLSKKMGEIYEKWWETGQSSATLDDPKRVQELNDIVHNLIPSERLFRRFSDLNARQTATNFPTPRGGARVEDIPINFAKTDIPTDKQGIISKGIQKAHDFVFPPANVDPSVSQIANLREQMMTRDGEALSGINDVFDRRNGSGPELLPMSNQAAQVQYQPLSRPNLGGPASASALGSMLSRPVEEPPKFPRKIRELVGNLPRFVQEIAHHVDPQAGDMVKQILSSSDSPNEKARQLGLFLTRFPEANSLFESGKSGLSSELDGRLHSPEDLASAAQMIEQSGKSTREKAKNWQTLWRDKKFKGSVQ
jgi:hypothetical protein